MSSEEKCTQSCHFIVCFFNNVPLSYFLFMQRWNGTDIKSLVVQICDFTGDAFQGEEWV
jgi:hypothetical protein